MQPQIHRDNNGGGDNKDNSNKKSDDGSNHHTEFKLPPGFKPRHEGLCDHGMCAIRADDHDNSNNNNNNNGLCHPHANCPPHVNDNQNNGDENTPKVIRHTDRPDSSCAFNPGQGKCKADCTEDQSFCECPRGFVMNEDDHCATKKCPRGFEQHAEDETSTCFPKASTLSGGGGGSGKSRHTTTTVIQQQQPQTITGFNATFYDANTPYCWYTVNAPPCYDIKTGTVIH